MSTWKTLNLESDVESDNEQIDDTKEIQIEEALKLYQTALKYHSEGPESYEKAGEAYRSLFKSEIFSYPESQSESRRIELYGDDIDYDALLLQDYDVGPVQLVGNTESAPNTLPQILHLSYKNYGQFMLDWMQYRLRQHMNGVQDHSADVEPPKLAVVADTALRHFSEALDKDDSDLDLWSRTSSVAALVGSTRIARFCLEAVLDGEDEGLDAILQLPGLEEGYAAQQLRELVEVLQDDLSLLLEPLLSLKCKRLSSLIMKRLNRYPLVLPPSTAFKAGNTDETPRPALKLFLRPSRLDWTAVGEAILAQHFSEQSGYTDICPGPGVGITMPPDAESDDPAMAPVPREPQQISKESSSPEKSTLAGEEADSNALKSGSSATAPGNADGDVEMPDSSARLSGQEGESKSIERTDTPNPNSRKRSTDSAGLPETAEGGRARSKRIRARETVAESTGPDAVANDPDGWIKFELEKFEKADRWLFEVTGELLGRLGVTSLGSSDSLRKIFTNPDQVLSKEQDDLKIAIKDLNTIVKSSPPQATAILLNVDTIDHLAGTSREAGLNAFLGYSKTGGSQPCTKPVLDRGQGLTGWSNNINSDWLSLREVAWSWLQCLLRQGAFPPSSLSPPDDRSSYVAHQWPDHLKSAVVQLLVNLDEFIFERMLDEVSSLDTCVLGAQTENSIHQFTRQEISTVEMTETLFEIHLDVYSLIKHPSSGVDVNLQIAQNDRLERWAALARDAVKLSPNNSQGLTLDELALRHIWASAFHVTVSENVDKQHVTWCIEDLKSIFKGIGSPIIQLQNNAVMPELSVSAADRELTRISMKDFFLRVFDEHEKDPVVVIESLEPILEPPPPTEVEEAISNDGRVQTPSNVAISAEDQSEVVRSDVQAAQRSPTKEMTKFLQSASINLRLSLWQRLREAYEAIEYTPRIVSCYLRSIELLMEELNNSAYQDAKEGQRELTLLRWIRCIDEFISKIQLLFKADTTAPDFLDPIRLKSSLNALATFLRLLHSANVFEDSVRAGQVPAPNYEGRLNPSYAVVTSKLHDVQVRTWILVYTLVKESMGQDPELFPNPSDDKLDYLRHVYHASGIRNFCQASNKQFLRLLKDELLQFTDISDKECRDSVICQVLHDLYGLMCFKDSSDCMDYNCVPEPVERKTASQILDFIMGQARKISIKDLPRAEMKTTIDKVHGALGRPKANEDLSFNRKILNTYLKSAVNPVRLYRCLQGIGSISSKPISPKRAIAASKGWYFLMGSIALNKFRSQKRMAPGPTEDINFAAAFFTQDLEYSMDRWETWYRLAQAYDSQIEEAVSWSAEKLNNNSVEIVQLQRSAINCYTMAVACAIAASDITMETASKVAEMYADFGMRIYASSREPFSMQAFNVNESEEKFFSGHNPLYRQGAFNPLKPYVAWKFASGLFKRAISRKPGYWMNYYMLGKCLWKMHTANEDVRGDGERPDVNKVIKVFVKAIEASPERKNREPILEPHYKLVSIIYKLVMRREIELETANKILQATPYANKFPACEDMDEWESHTLQTLKTLRGADKSGWHHRMIARAAHVIYDESSSSPIAAGAAKHELTLQMFTKTMSIQVWKPEYERAGRHFVYTTRYTRFFMRLLVQLVDMSSMEALAKRVRKRVHDFYEHQKLWQELCTAYLKLLRRSGRIPEGHEDTAFKNLNHEEFTANSTRLETWAQSNDKKPEIINTLRDAIELKRLNNGLMKSLLIDDLVVDTYALIYAQIVPTFEPLPPAPPAQPATVPLTERPNVMSMNNFLIMDGARDAVPGAQGTLTVGGVAPSSHSDSVTKTRQKGVGRRELQRKAEALVQAAATTVNAIPIRPPPPQNNSGTVTQVVISMPPQDDRPSESVPAVEPVGSPKPVLEPGMTVEAEDHEAGSGHDDAGDADDESELSELEEEEEEEDVGVEGSHLNGELADSATATPAEITPEPELV